MAQESTYLNNLLVPCLSFLARPDAENIGRDQLVFQDFVTKSQPQKSLGTMPQLATGPDAENGEISLCPRTCKRFSVTKSPKLSKTINI